jgi:hypothetical protein
MTTHSSQRPRRTLRSVGAVFAGLLFIFVVTTAVDVVMHATGIYPPWGVRMADPLFVLAFAYRFLLNVGGCYLAARLAPQRPMRHALVLGAIGLVLSIAGAVAMGDQGPAWYSLGLIATALPCAWAGGRLRELSSAEASLRVLAG